MKVYVQVEDKRFSNIEEAVAAFNDTDIEQFDIDVYNAETEEMLDYQTVSRNPYSGDIEYYRWYIGYIPYNDLVEVLDYDCNCKEEALEKAEKYLNKYDNVFVCTYLQTLSENIGDESVDRIFLNKEEE